MSESGQREMSGKVCAICGERLGKPPYIRLSEDDALVMHLSCYATTRNEGRLASARQLPSDAPE